MIPTLDDERLVASDYVPIRSALAAAAEIREELADQPIWEIRVGYDGVTVVDMLGVDYADAAASILGLIAREETRKGVGYRGIWRGADIRVIAAKPSRIVRAWLRVTGQLRRRRDLAQVVGLAMCFGPLLAVIVNGTNPFGAVTWVLVSAGFLLAAVAIGGTRILHTTYRRRDQS